MRLLYIISLVSVTVQDIVTSQSLAYPNIDVLSISVTTLSSDGCTTTGHVVPVLVPLFTSVCVANSTVQRVVCVAANGAVPVDTICHIAKSVL